MATYSIKESFHVFIYLNEKLSLKFISIFHKKYGLDIEKLFCILCSFEYLTLESRHVASIRILPHEYQTTAKSRKTFLYSVNIQIWKEYFSYPIIGSSH